MSLPLNSFTTALSAITILCYLASAVWLARSVLIGYTVTHRLFQGVAAAWVGHLLVVCLTLSQQLPSYSLTLPQVMALIAVCVTGLVLFFCLRKPMANLFVFILPLAALSLAGMTFTEALPLEVLPYTTAQLWHIGLSIIAFSVLFAAALQAILLGLGEYWVKNKRFHQTMQCLPPLQTMENLLFQCVSIGVVLLTLVLITSVISFEEIWAGEYLEKTLLTFLAWFIFLGLLLGRHLYGWRGRVAVNWTMMGMSLLFLSYFGSRLFFDIN